MFIGLTHPMTMKDELKEARVTISMIKDILDETIDKLNSLALLESKANAEDDMEQANWFNGGGCALLTTAIQLSIALEADLQQVQRNELGFEDCPDDCWFYYLEGEKGRAIEAAIKKGRV